MDYSSAATKALLNPRAAQAALCAGLIVAPLYIFFVRPHISRRGGNGGGGCCLCAAGVCAGRGLLMPCRLLWALFYRVFLLTAAVVLGICHAVIAGAKGVRQAVQSARASLDDRHARVLRERVAWSKADAAKVAKKYGGLYADKDTVGTSSSSSLESSDADVEEEEEEAPVVPTPRASAGARRSSPRASASPSRQDALLNTELDGAPRMSGTTHHEAVPLAEELEEALDGVPEEQQRQMSRLEADLVVRGTKAVLHPAAAPTRLRRRDAPARWVQSLRNGYEASSMRRPRVPVLSLENHVRGLFSHFDRQRRYKESDLTAASLEHLYSRPAFQEWYAASRNDLFEEVRLRRHFVVWRSVLVLALVVVSLVALPAFSFSNKAKISLLTPVPAGVEASAATFSQLLVTRMQYLQGASVEARVPAWCAARCPATAALIGSTALSAEMLVLVAAVLACFTAAFMPRRAPSSATAALIAFTIVVAEAAQAAPNGRVTLGMGFLSGFGLVAASIAKAMN